MGKPDRFNNQTIQAAASKMLPGCTTDVSCHGKGFWLQVRAGEKSVGTHFEMPDAMTEFDVFSTKFLQPMIASLSNG